MKKFLIFLSFISILSFTSNAAFNRLKPSELASIKTCSLYLYVQEHLKINCDKLQKIQEDKVQYENLKKDVEEKMSSLSKKSKKRYNKYVQTNFTSTDEEDDKDKDEDEDVDESEVNPIDALSNICTKGYERCVHIYEKTINPPKLKRAKCNMYFSKRTCQETIVRAAAELFWKIQIPKPGSTTGETISVCQEQHVKNCIASNPLLKSAEKDEERIPRLLKVFIININHKATGKALTWRLFQFTAVVASVILAPQIANLLEKFDIVEQAKGALESTNELADLTD
jgi:Skp family chaperone for outer membrane proteins